MANFSLPPVGMQSPTSGSSSSAKLPTDPKANKEAVKKMFEQSIFEQLQKDRDKATERMKNALKGGGADNFAPL